MTLWVYLVCALFLCVCATLWRYERGMRRKFEGLPTLPLLPFLGNIHQILGDGKRVFRILNKVSDVSDKAAMPFVIWLGPCPFLVIQDPENVKLITNTFIEKPFFYEFGKPWLGNGLVTAPGIIWKHNIKNLAGTFTASVVDGYLGVFNAQSSILVEDLKKKVGMEPFDIMHFMARTTLESICQTALGVSEITESIVTTEYYEAFNRTLELLISRGLNVFLYPDAVYRLTPAHRELNKCIAILHNVSETVMRKRKLDRHRRNISEITINNNYDDHAPKFKAFLDILIALGESDPSLTEQQIKSEVDTIIVGGQETVTTTLFFTLLNIGSRLDIQEKMYAELRSIFGDSNRPVSKEDLPRMVYCEAVIYETLRLFPPIPGVIRYADKDLKLKSFTIPEGTLCGINAWGAGRSVHSWGPDAKVYRPERWLEDQTPTNPGAFLAFSYGRRACIGKRYAMTIIKTVLAHCLRELEFHSRAEELQLKLDLALRPVSGHLVQVTLRNKCDKQT